MVVLEELVKEYEEFKIDGLDLHIKEGEFLTLLGGSGCGKSTLLRLISGIDSEYRGSIKIDGVDIRGKSTFETGLSMVFQDSLLLPNLNVEDNVAFGLKMKGISKKERLEKARKALKELGLSGFEKRHPNDLSGGQKQRVSIARALVMEPKVLLMDEPFSALDEGLREKLQKLLKKIQKNHRSTILFVTHDRDEAFYLSDRIAIMEEGRIVQLDEPQKLYENPTNKRVANFLGINNIISGTVKDNYILDGSFKLEVDTRDSDDVIIALKAEDMRIVERECDKSKETKFFAGIIEDISFKSGFYHFFLDIDGRKIEVVQNRVDTPVHIGLEVDITYKKNNIIYIKR